MYQVHPQPRLWTAARPRGGAWLPSEIDTWRAAGVGHVVCMLTAAEMAELDVSAEQQICRDSGLTFTHLPLPDRTEPTSTRAFYKALRPVWTAFESDVGVMSHCRQGIGRSSLVAAALMVEFGMESTDAWTRIAAARGREVPDTRGQRDWLLGYAGWLELNRRMGW